METHNIRSRCRSRTKVVDRAKRLSLFGCFLIFFPDDLQSNEVRCAFVKILSQIDGPKKVYNSRDPCVRATASSWTSRKLPNVGRTEQQRQVRPSAPTDRPDTIRIKPVLRRFPLDEKNRFLAVLDHGGPFVLWRKSIVNVCDRNSPVSQFQGQGGHVRSRSAHPGPAMDHDYDRSRP